APGNGARRLAEPALSGSKRQSRRVGWKQWWQRSIRPGDSSFQEGDHPMAIERLKFRCYRCNQLLAVAPSKAGTIVSCPKCQADLLIPAAEVRTKGAGETRAKGEAERPRKSGSDADIRVRSEAAAILGASAEPPAPDPMPTVLG